MELLTAISLIEKGVRASKVQTWADFGAGDGLFTRALSTLLYTGSTINAIDKKLSAMNSLSLYTPGIALKKIGADFETYNFGQLDGVLMANSLHFIKNQLKFLQRLRTILIPNGQLIIVEYDSDKSNMWVPYPMSFETLNQNVIAGGFRGATKLHDVPSRFGRTNIYSAKIEF
ncbi:MAG: methyltransferase domain-containing protein [Chryseolinea sp.]